MPYKEHFSQGHSPLKLVTGGQNNVHIHVATVSFEIFQNEESDTSTVQLTSKYGQPYQCNFPNTVEQEKQKEEAEKVAMETGIPDLLKPMESGPCLRKVYSPF